MKNFLAAQLTGITGNHPACGVFTSIEEKTIKKHKEMAMVISDVSVNGAWILRKSVFGKRCLLFTSSNGNALQMSV